MILAIFLAAASAKTTEFQQSEKGQKFENFNEDPQQYREKMEQIQRQAENQRQESHGYEFSYSVDDPLTGDNKHQEETKVNGNVKGQYSWIDADGFRQIVDYHADEHKGFNSESRKEPVNGHRYQRVHIATPYVATPLYTIDTIVAPYYARAHHNNYNTNKNNQQAHNNARSESEVKFSGPNASYQYRNQF